MAGWGDDPVMADLQSAIAEGWAPVEVREDTQTPGGPFDVVKVRKDGEEREFRSDHLAFHRYVEGLIEDYGLSYG